MVYTINCLTVRVVVIKEIHFERPELVREAHVQFQLLRNASRSEGPLPVARRITTRAPRYSSNACTSPPTGAYAFHEITASSAVEFFLHHEDRQARVDNCMVFAIIYVLTLACIFDRYFEFALKKKRTGVAKEQYARPIHRIQQFKKNKISSYI